MAKIAKLLFAGLVVLTLSGCAVATKIQPQTAAATGVSNGKSFSSPVAVDYAFQASDLDVPVKVTGYTGSACSFPLQLSGAFYSTFNAINQQAFRNEANARSQDAYRVRFDLNSFDNSLTFAPGFFSSTAIAHTEITMRVSVYDPKGKELTRQLIRGNGQQQADVGSCAGGSDAVAGAVGKALRQIGEDYAYRIINSLQIE